VLRYSRLDVIVEGGWLEPETEFTAGFEIKTETDALLFAADTLAENGQTVTLPADDPYRKEIDYFIDCCRAGAKPERCMPRDSANAVRVAALVKQARETGREVLWQ
jgi:predicted dehydrogenase